MQRFRLNVKIILGICFIFLCILMSSFCRKQSDWARVCVKRDSEGHWEVMLENEKIKVHYGYYYNKNDKTEHGLISEFILKEFPDENAAYHFLDAAAHRGMIKNASIVKDDVDEKTIRIEWEPNPKSKDKFHGPAVSLVSIFPNSRYIKIKYLSYCFPHVVDMGPPGCLQKKATDAECGRYAIYGAEEWLKQRQKLPAQGDWCANKNDPYEFGGMDQNELYPLYEKSFYCYKWTDPGPLSYKGWYIMGVYNEKNGRGYGRIVPIDAITIIKLLWNKGFELFPFFGQTAKAFTSYLFLVTGGEEEIISVGKELVDKNDL